MDFLSFIVNSDLSDRKTQDLHIYPHHTFGKILWNIWKISIGGRIGMACGSIFIMHILLWVVGRYFQCAVFLSFMEFLDLVDINIWE